MSFSATPPVGEVSRSVHARSLRKHIAAVVATFFLATCFALAGAPAATAAPASADTGSSTDSAASPGHDAVSCRCPPGTILVSCMGGAPICQAASGGAASGLPLEED